MQIKNASDIVVSWFCFNQSDVVKLIALASGDLERADTFDYTPPHNGNDLYFVRFTSKGGGAELAGGTVGRTGQVVQLTGRKGSYQARITGQ